MTMGYRLSEHDRKVLTYGATAAAIMVVYAYGISPWVADWQKTRAMTAANVRTIESLAGSTGRRTNQASIVPVMEMPVATEKQQHLFKTKFNEQLIAAGIQAKSVQYVSTGKTPNETGFTVSKLKCDGKSNMAQVAKLLASLPENPYFLGVDELRLSCDPKTRQDITLSITVSTF
jgi:hypothetical protein